MQIFQWVYIKFKSVWKYEPFLQNSGIMLNFGKLEMTIPNKNVMPVWLLLGTAVWNMFYPGNLYGISTTHIE